MLSMVLRQAAVLAGAGLAAGLAASFALTRFLSTLLFEVRTTDLATLATIAALLAAVALAASYLPARRAASVDPMVALRYRVSFRGRLRWPAEPRLYDTNEARTLIKRRVSSAGTA